MEKRITNNRGQGLIEYIALTTLIAIVSITAIRSFGSKVNKRLTQISNAFDHQIQIGLKRKASDTETDPLDSEFEAIESKKHKKPLLESILNP